MGLKNAPKILQRRMDSIFNEYSDFCLVYVDVILIFSSNIANHAMLLMQFIQKCRIDGLILYAKKTEIAKEQLSSYVLGLIVEASKCNLMFSKRSPTFLIK